MAAMTTTTAEPFVLIIRSARLQPSGTSRRLEPRVPGAERFLTDRRESHHQLRVVVECLDAEHGSDAELWMSDFHAEPERDSARRLILVLIRVGRGRFTHPIPAAAAAVGVRAEFVVCEIPLVGRRRI